MNAPHILPAGQAQGADRIHITDIEAALNWLRAQYPSPDGLSLAQPLHQLAEVYALMVYYRQEWVAAQGDAICKGCGRTELEVQNWQAMQPVAKRMVWRRITQEGSAWRFNKYAERAVEGIGQQSFDFGSGLSRPLQ